MRFLITLLQMVNLRNGTGELEEDETRRKVHLIRTLFGLDKKKAE